MVDARVGRAGVPVSDPCPISLVSPAVDEIANLPPVRRDETMNAREREREQHGDEPMIRSEAAADQSQAGLTRTFRRVGRALVWPVARFFDPRFQGLARQAQVQHADLMRRAERLHAELVEERGIARERYEEAARLLEQARNDVLESVAEVRELAESEINAATDATELIGRSLAEIHGELETIGRTLEDLREQLSRSRADRTRPAP